MTSGLLSYGAYVPYHRLKRSEIAAVLGEGGGRGTRAVASYDEDPTSMAVEAGRLALRDVPAAAHPQRLLLATATPPYLDKTNANVVHAALGLDPGVLAIDVVGSVRSGAGALLLAAESPTPTLAVLADVRSGLPGGADERDGGDAAAAFLFGAERDGEPAIAELVAVGIDDGGVPRSVAPPRRALVPGVGGSLRRARVRPAGRRCVRRRAEAGPPDPERHPRARRRRHPRSRRARLRRRRRRRACRRRPRHDHRQLGHGPGRCPARRHAGPGRARPDDRPRGAGRRRHRLRPPHDRRHRGTAAAVDGRGADRRRRRRPALRHVPDLARLPHQGAAPPAGPRRTGGAAVAADRVVQVRLRGQSLHGVRDGAPPAGAGVRAVQGARPHGAGADGRRGRHHRHVHARPAGVLAEPSGGRRRRRLRRRRAVQLRGHRRRPGHRRHRRPRAR